ncbi:MAG: aminotransferase class V-fold PLP-dependent enzyme, partial [Leptospira sp.]|nr:aminotransferase class V-fold PLP-dependent enzyme [Leptospira sp.]
IAYFDYNATHPPFEEIIRKANEDYFYSYFNPSGATRFSLSMQSKIEGARKYFAKICGKPEKNFVFSSTGTEANFLLLTALSSVTNVSKNAIVSPFEHSSFYAGLSKSGFAQEIIRTDMTGLIDLNDLEKKLQKFSSETKNQIPVFIIYAGNETGVVQPMTEAKKLCEKFNALLFSDVIQAFGKIDLEFQILNGFTFSSHKIGGGPGSALTYVDDVLVVEGFSIFKGGNQENGHRAGTENTPSIISFEESAKKQLEEMRTKNERLYRFRKIIEERLKESGATIVAEGSPRLPSTTFTLLPTENIDFFMIGMEEKGIIVSTGSSCRSRSRDASNSLLRMGYSKDDALRAIRVSTGYFTREQDVEYLLDSAVEILRKL